MTNYALLYFGGSQPTTAEEGEKVMAAWVSWFGTVGEGIVDPGNPFGPSLSIGATASPSGASGYSIVAAESLDAAKKLLDGHPHLASSDDARIEVFEILPM